MFDAEKGSAQRCDGSDLHIGLVQARFNESITGALADACRSQLLELGVREEHITHVCWYPAPSKSPPPCKRWPSAMSLMR